MQCPNCGATAPDDYRFCEECGTGLTAASGDAARAAPTERCRCGAGQEAKDAQGFCMACGRRWEPSGRDHVELVLAANFSAVTDRGLRHPRNEDEVALTMCATADKPVYVMVVCDGVSSSQIPDMASATAAHAAEKALLGAAQSGATDLKAATVDAILTAQHAVCALPFRPEGPKDPPATTIVTALISAGVATIGWVGDSRAYWFTDATGGMLTHDHSWINEVVDAGEMTEEEAMHAPQAHAITQCLGLFSEDGTEAIPPPSVVTFELPPSCRLLLCTDGLWNYAASTEAIAELIRQAPVDAGTVGVCRVLVDYVLTQGARDNVTVALLAV